MSWAWLGGGRGSRLLSPARCYPETTPSLPKSSILGHTRGIGTALLYLAALARQRTVPPIEKALINACGLGWELKGKTLPPSSGVTGRCCRSGPEN